MSPFRESTTLIDVLHWRARHQSDDRAYTFMVDGETEGPALTYGQLGRQARAIGAWLQQHGTPGERALLLYPQSLDVMTAFYGCLCAGVIAIPVPPPEASRLKRTLPRLQAVAKDAQASFVLTTRAIISLIDEFRSEIPEFQAMRWLATEDVAPDLAEEWQDPGVGTETLAYLQYTSGSTSTPKGVMISHGNVMSHCAYLKEACEYTDESKTVTWMPYFHDYGLVEGLLVPVYNGTPCYVMSPFSFIKNPFRWLHIISRYRCTHSQAPNFAYDQCVRRVGPEQRAELDLSCWRAAGNAAEPINPEVLERFFQAFAPGGLRREALCPAYGLAEATLLVSFSPTSKEPVLCNAEAAALEKGRVVEADGTQALTRTVAGCGRRVSQTQIVIADPETLRKCGPNEVGEVWVAAPGVAQGYWNRPEETEQIFQAHLADTGEGPFLRTGDLGFLRDGELFLNGRLKDLIIVRGANHYPQDLEWTVQRSHPALRAENGAAFAVEADGQERLVVVQELERRHRGVDLAEVIAAIRTAVSEEHEVELHALVLVKAGSILKTSSGKIQRQGCAAAFLSGRLTVVAEWRQAPQDDEDAELPSEERSAGRAAPTVHEIRNWLIAKLAQHLKVDAQRIDVRQPFASFGLDSMTAVCITGELEEWLGRTLPHTLAYDYPTIEALGEHLAGRPAAGVAAGHDGAERGTEAEPIAIIGMGCRFPGAKSPDEFWQLLRAGADAITEVPSSRRGLGLFGHLDHDSSAIMDGRWGGFLDHVEQFDPQFFGISPREAEQMDPQQRLLLEVAWEALEQAGQAPDRLAGSDAGVFVGISSYDYSQLLFSDPAGADAYAGTGSALSIAANRLSYLLNLRGPSWAVDTACSSSLVAVHQACQSLRAGECHLAIAGGVNLILSGAMTLALVQAGMLAADGRCKTFDARADGYVRGEGAGLVVLKPLSAARRDGDHVHAAIRGAAVNQDGRSNGLTAPNGPSQQAVVRQALARAGVAPPEISYVETHGTGTALGDPIEVNSLREVLMAGRSASDPCWLGSVKTNIGHLEAAAGIAGLIKVALSMEHGEIPPTLHLEQLNPQINIDDTPLSIPTERSPWPDGGRRRIAGVSSFGFGGTNAHVIVEAAPAAVEDEARVARPEHLLALSAQGESALRDLTQRYECHLQQHPAQPLADVCHTANTGRTHFEHRLAIVAQSSAQLQQRLGDYLAGRTVSGLARGRARVGHAPKIALLFTGQGSQYVAMGRELYETMPAFRRTLDRSDEILRPHLARPLLEVLYGHPGDDSLLNETANTQPALFALEYALAELWQSWGIRPAAVMGHSVGEYAAACVAGVFSLEDGLRLMAARARLIQALPRDGEMVALLCDESRVREALERHATEVSVAAVNGPRNTVVSGKQEAVAEVVAALEGTGVRAVKLAVSHAFHSALMEPMLSDFGRVAEDVTYSEPRLELISNVTGQLARGEVATPEYWGRHVRRPVRFMAGMAALHQRGYDAFVEIGPRPILLEMGRQCLPEGVGLWLPSLRRARSDWQVLLQSLGELYVNGAPIDWQSFDREYSRRKVALPTYPFQRKRHWVKARRAAPQAGPSTAGREATHPLLGQRLRLPLSQEVRFESRLRADAAPYLDEHRLYGTPVAPAASHISMMLSAACEAWNWDSCTLEDLLFSQALALPEQSHTAVQLILTPDDAGENLCQLASQGAPDNEAASWLVHASARARRSEEAAATAFDPARMAEMQAQCSYTVSGEDYYSAVWEAAGYDLGNSLRWVKRIWQVGDEALAQLGAPELSDDTDAYLLYPGLLDSCFQLMGLWFGSAEELVRSKQLYVPFRVASFTFLGPPPAPGAPLWCHARRHAGQDDGTLLGDVQLLDEAGRVLAEARRFELRRADRDALLAATDESWTRWLYRIEWHRQARQGRPLPSEYLPAPAAVKSRLMPRLDQLLSQPGAKLHGEQLRQLEALCVDYVLAALRQLGWRPEVGARFTTDELADELGVVDRHRRLFGRLLAILAEEEVLRLQGDQAEVLSAPDADDPDERWRALVAQYPAAGAELTLLGRCAARLAEVLRGAQDPLDLLFPEGDLTTAEALYRESPPFAAMNTMLAQAVAEALEQLPPTRELRVLEVGAGTGGTTSYVLPQLPAGRTEYVFTDVSSLFTAKAREKFSEHAFLRYQALDIETAPESQGYDAQSYDLILAANVVHATRDLRATLQHLQRLLAPGGMLLLIEATAPQRWLDLVFGLLEGWWRFADHDLRPSYPLLSPAQWEELLNRSGFEGAAAVSAAWGSFEQTLVMARATRSVSRDSGKWLILADGEGVGQRLAAHLEPLGQACILAFPGSGYEQVSAREWRIDPANPADFHRLVAEAAPLRGVAHLWSLDTTMPETVEDVQAAAASSGRVIASAVKTGCASALHLVQSLVEAELPESPSLWLVTRGAQVVGAEEGVPGAAHSPLWGLGKAIALEHPELHCVPVDLDGGAPEDAARALLAEMWSGDPEDHVAFREGTRYVARLAPHTATDVGHIRLREDASYLITGGLGGLGPLVARRMVERGAQNLALLGRSEPRPEVNAQLEALAALGAKVDVVLADVTNPGQLAEALANMKAERPPLRGVIHAAGVLNDGVLRQQTWSRFEEVLAPKMLGGWNLHVLTQDLPLDFFVLFSSTASLFGSAGQANHAAANAFLDALAHYRRARGLPGTSINWGAWAQVGAAAEGPVAERMRKRGIGDMRPDQCLRAFDSLVSQGLAQAGVARIDWPRFLKHQPSPFFMKVAGAAGRPEEHGTGALDELGAAPPGERRGLLMTQVSAEVAGVLGLSRSDSIDPQKGLASLGMDSLTAMELRNRLQARLTCSLPPTLAFDYPTVEALTEFLASGVLSADLFSQPAADSEAERKPLAADEEDRIDQLSEEELTALLDERLVRAEQRMAELEGK